MPSTLNNRAFWDSPDGVERARSYDSGLRALDELAIQSAVKNSIRPKQRILDAGCGTGGLARRLALAHPSYTVEGIDQSTAMIAATNAEGCARLSFRQQDLLDLMDQPEQYDLIYTQQVIINFPTWAEQREALLAIATALKPNGRYLMCESIKEGLDAINRTRKWVGLSEIVPPAMARYLWTSQLDRLQVGLLNSHREPFSSEYYFISRVVNAWLALCEGKDPNYDAQVNHLGMTLPAGVVSDTFAQTQLWTWQKEF